MDDIVINKAATIERCLRRVREVFADDERNIYADQTRQDSIVLNIQRACETAIDLAMHLVRRGRLGVPQESRDAFELLATAGSLERELGERLKSMVGFRNVAVHDYQALNLDIVREIVRHRLGDLARFAEWASKTTAQSTY
jgi:uncharacterized protein YutE (UPF0331/DUF86 family)